MIAVDFDDIIVDFVGCFVNYHNENYGSIINYDDVNEFSLEKVFNVSQEVIVDRLWKFVHTQHLHLPLMLHASACLKQLSKMAEVHIVTSRCETISDITQANLKHLNVSVHISKTHFTNGLLLTRHPERSREKVEVCKEIGAGVLIDDLPLHAEKASKQGIPALIMTRPWNRNHALATNVERVENWHEAIHWINQNIL